MYCYKIGYNNPTNSPVINVKLREAANPHIKEKRNVRHLKLNMIIFGINASNIPFFAALDFTLSSFKAQNDQVVNCTRTWLMQNSECKTMISQLVWSTPNKRISANVYILNMDIFYILQQLYIQYSILASLCVTYDFSRMMTQVLCAEL